MSEPLHSDIEQLLLVIGAILAVKEGDRWRQYETLRLECEARWLVAEFPEIGEREVAEQVVQLSAEIADSIGCPELANEPAMWRACVATPDGETWDTSAVGSAQEGSMATEVIEAVEAEATASTGRIRALVLDAIDEGCVGPDEIAAYTYERLDESELPDLVQGLLRPHVRSMLARIRHESMEARTHKPGKWEEARSILAGRVCVRGQWKPLAECDMKDLADLVQQYKDAAAHNIAVAQQYSRLLKTLQQRKLSTVGQLSEDEVRGALDG